MQNNQAIFESLFGRNFSDPGNTAFLEELTSEHPYFSPAQFYLLQQTNSGSASFEKQALKTNIYFNNPYWLNFQLQQTGSATQQAARVNEQIKIAEPEHAQPRVIEFELIIPEPKVVETVLSAPAAPEPAISQPVDNLPDDTDGAEIMEKEIEPMHIELKFPVESMNTNEAMLFEPMHVVDYFASQGIKLTDEVQTADKLGRQLKSFTEWLKIMKKVHVENDAETNADTDNNIQRLAENSNAGAEVLTESMAEVFARQGKAGKAGEVYKKLSLLNPAKSAYFAAKIENLKGI